MRSSRVSVALLAAAILHAAPSAGQDATPRATAEALFAEGRRLMASGDYAAACAKLAASQKIDPGVGTTLNLADCYEKSGRVASAWVEFREAISAARVSGSKEREQLARDRARMLESKLSYLTITTGPAQRSTIQMMRDATPVEGAAIGTPIPVDPGKHKLEATAPGKKTWSQMFDVPNVPTKLAINVPDLEDERQTGGAASPSPTAPVDAANHSGAQRGVGISLLVVGVLGVTAGTVFGFKAKSAWSDAKTHCSSYPYGCGSDGVSLGEDAKSAGTLSTVGFVIGGAGLVGGAVVYLTARKESASEKSIALRLTPSSVTIGGQF